MSDFSNQELGLLRLLIRGATNGKAAKHFGVCVRTIESRRQRIMLKLRAGSSVQLGYHFAKWENGDRGAE